MSYSNKALEMFQKIRAMVEDFDQIATEVFIYENSNVFPLAEPRVKELWSYQINGHDLVSGQSAEFDAYENELTIINPDFVSGDVITIKYVYNKFSNAELLEFIRSALIWLNIYSSKFNSIKLTASGDIFPQLSPREENLVCALSAILIKPDYISYKTGNMSITYPTKVTKEEKIETLVQSFEGNTGTVGVIEWN